ncbi:MAG: SLC13 family permease [Planctomycetaceae bacterium]
MNNTPIVAMVMPLMNEWSRKIGISISHLLLPLSYATILGGMCTLIGTSTTVVLNGTLPYYEKEGLTTMGMYDITVVGVPITIVGLAYLLFFSKRLIPERKSAHQEMSNAREYSVEMLLDPSSPLVGQTIEQAGLRSLPGMYLIEIERNDDVLPAVSPQERLMGNDRLIFVGVVDSVIDLQKFPGLKTAADQQFRLEKRHHDRVLIEAVVANSFPFKNRTIRDARFRSYYNAAVIAVTRDGQRVNKKIGDITLESGDTLLLEARPSFLEAQRNSRDFYLVSEVQNSRAPRHERAWAARLIMIGMIILVSFPFFGIDMLKGSMLAACVMIATRCCRASEAKASIDLSVLLTIGAGIGLGEAMIHTETHHYLAAKLVAGINYLGDGFKSNPRLALGLICGMTMVFNNVITAKAAGLLCLPIAVAIAVELGVHPWPFAIAVIIGAASSFVTPHGYQTNQMVYGPGGYKPRDYFMIGVPLSIIICLITTIMTPGSGRFSRSLLSEAE